MGMKQILLSRHKFSPRPGIMQVAHKFLDCGNLERGFARLLVRVPNDRLPPPVQSLADSATSAGLWA